MKLRIFNWRQGQNERFLETRKTKAMWYSTPAKIHSELNAFYPFYTLVLLIIKMIWEIQYCLFHEHHFVKTIWKYNCSTTTSTILWKSFENTIAVLSRAPLRLLCLPGQSPKRSCLHKVSSLSQIFSDVQWLLYSDVLMFRCSGSLISWCLDVQRLRCWECDHVVQCSKVHKFICSEVECSSARCSKASRKCSKYQLSLQMSSIWELYLMTQNARRNILQVFWTRLEQLSCPRINMTDANLMKPPI